MNLPALECDMSSETVPRERLQAATFKFWPEMDKEKSWERRVRLVATLCCCSGRVSRPGKEEESTPLARMALVFASVRLPSCSSGGCLAATSVCYSLYDNGLHAAAPAVRR